MNRVKQHLKILGAIDAKLNSVMESNKWSAMLLLILLTISRRVKDQKEAKKVFPVSRSDFLR